MNAPLSPPNFQRLFWPVAIGLAALLATALLVDPVAAISGHASRNNNEGWNAYLQQDAMRGTPLYPSPPELVGKNYPPLSFHLIGLASRLTGNVNQTGRWVAILSLALVAALCGGLVRRFTASAPLALYTALNVVIWLAVYMPSRIGVNDPQLLAMVFSLVGFYMYIREPEKLLWLSLSAAVFTVSVFTKHNLLAFPSAVCAHLIVRKWWKGLLVWCGVVACASALVVALTRWIDGPYFFASVLIPRTRTDSLQVFTAFLTTFQAPVALAVFWSLRRGAQSLRHVMALALILSLVVGAVFAGGDGVDKNIFFDCVLVLIIVGSLLFAEYAPLLTGVSRRSFLLAALLAAPALSVALAAPQTLREERGDLLRMPARERDFDLSVALLRSRPGPALCQTLLACFDAGKPLLYDPCYTNIELHVGRIPEEELVAFVESARFRTVQLELAWGETTLKPAARWQFSAGIVDALLKRYHVEATLGGSVVLAANQ
jgi:hypothetical protein